MKDRSGNTNWSLEVEEGWVPYKIFITHFLKENQEVIYTCNPKANFLNNYCSLYQVHFGPKEAILALKEPLH